MITIVDYGAGNIGSIKNMIRKIGGDAVLASRPEDIAGAEKLILPGVGHFDYGMRQLHNSELLTALNESVLERKVPILGICLGVQLFTKGSEEGEFPGLGWFNAETVKFAFDDVNRLKIPHMGWNEIEIVGQSKLFDGMDNASRFYFVHTFHLKCMDASDSISVTNYGYPFVSGIERNNIVGVQFHPEKSHKFGMQVMKNFAEKY